MNRALLAVVGAALAGPGALGCDPPRTGVVLWHAYTGAERTALEATAARWNDAHPQQPLQLVAVPFQPFADKLTSAIPGGNGPDLFIYPQDRLGDWADAHTIEPIEYWVDDPHADRFADESLAAMAYHGSLWGLPVAAKSLVLYYRPDLIATPPATTDDLMSLGPTMRARDGYALAYANGGLYGHAPWLFGYGGRIVDPDGKLDLATPAAAAAMGFARELVAREVAPGNPQGPQVASLFNAGKAATVISGPWFQADIAAGVPWKVTTLPIVSATGRPATPFAGAEALMMSSRTHDKDAAFAVMDYLTSDEAAVIRAKQARQVVPNRHAYDDPEVAADQTLATFRAQLTHSVPMPNEAAMRMVWDPYQTALGEVLTGRVEPGPALLKVDRELTTYLKRSP